MMKRILLASTLLCVASPTIAGPWLVGQQTPTYTDAHPLGAINSAPFYTAGEPADIPSNFTTSTWYHTGSPPVFSAGPGQYDGPGVGSESKARFDCNVAFSNSNDPIIAPGIVNGSTHEHTFFGNLDAAVNTQNVTYASLRASGNSTCYGGPLNRTLYWEPSIKKILTSGVTVTLKPKNIVTYYESGGLVDIGTGKITDPLVGTRWPRSLNMIEGFNMNDPTNTRVTNIITALNGLPGRAGQYSQIPASTAGGFVGWQCFAYDSGTGPQPYLRNADGTAAIHCTANTDIIAELLSDPCWDGKNPTSPNGRLHMMPFIRDNFNSKNVCPDNWYRVAQFRAKITFTQTGAADYKEWFASSDRMPGMPQFLNGQSMHFDLIPAWDYGTAAAPGAFLTFANHCDGQTIVTPDSGTSLTGDGHECGTGRISFTQNLYVNEASPDASLPNPVVNLNPAQTGALRYFPLANGTSVPGTVNNHH